MGTGDRDLLIGSRESDSPVGGLRFCSKREVMKERRKGSRCSESIDFAIQHIYKQLLVPCVINIHSPIEV